MTEVSQRLHAVVQGRVQGVNFRYYAQRHAANLGLVGWVRNLDDGRSVEVVAEGRKEALDLFLVFLREGSPTAHVLKVDVEWLESSGEFDDFAVIW